MSKKGEQLGAKIGQPANAGTTKGETNTDKKDAIGVVHGDAK